jgi:pimeloyl-ACP methyl ester carboxylesterase
VSVRWKILAAGWAVLLAGGALARAVQTAGGVEVRDVRFESRDGLRMSALLYVPPGATAATPAPAVLAVHGYINSRETQSGFAIELARRGYVVLALDQTGHGFSGGRALSAGYGGPAGLAYLRGLEFVDPDNVGLEGHSMGGWAVLQAAAAHPEGYRSVALVGSATGPGFAPAGSPEFPRNLGVVFSRYDEFSQLMWGVRDGAAVSESAKLRSVFGVSEGEPVVPGRVYGAIAEGTGRWLATPRTTHPGAHLSRAAIGDALRWLGMTLEGERELPADDQIWPWKEAGTLVALLGGLLVLLGAIDFLLSLPAFAGLCAARANPAERRPGPEGDLARRAAVEPARQGEARWLPARRQWAAIAVAALVPALTYFPLTTWGAALRPSALLPQGITNQILVWALANGVLALLVLGAARWSGRRRRASGVADRAGADARRGAAGAFALVALLASGMVYLAVAASQWLFLADLRFWVVALKPMAAHHVPTFLAYVLPFIAFFYLTQRAFFATVPLVGMRPWAQYAAGVVASAGGMALLVVALHATLLVRGHLPSFAGIGPLFSVIAIQFVPVLAATGAVSVFAWRRTHGPWLGALVCGLVVTWYIVAGQATHA